MAVFKEINCIYNHIKQFIVQIYKFQEGNYVIPPPSRFNYGFECFDKLLSVALDKEKGIRPSMSRFRDKLDEILTKGGNFPGLSCAPTPRTDRSLNIIAGYPNELKRLEQFQSKPAA